MGELKAGPKLAVMTEGLPPLLGRTPADRVEYFFRHYLKHVKGEWAGQPLVLAPWQRREIIKPLFGTRLPDKDKLRQYRTCYVEVPRKNAKGLALDTPIPTPDGWTTVGAIAVGAEIFDEAGQVVRVVATSEIRHVACYEITFSNGERIVADADHRWVTEARVDTLGRRSRAGLRHGESVMTRVRTTRELAATVRYGARGDRNHSVRMPDPIELPEAMLPIDPYVLGVWLGDGDSAGPRITCGETDQAHFVEEIRRAGYRVTRRRVTTAWRLLVQTVEPDLYGGDGAVTRRSPHNLQKILRGLGILGAKRIPVLYQRASSKQRLALLQGLMDTDGTADAAGVGLIYTTTSEALAGDVAELLASLGLKFSWRRCPLRCNGRPVEGVGHQLQFFVAANALPVFRLPRKLARQGRSATTRRRSRSVQITDVVPVVTVPTRCLTTDGPSQLFRVGRTMLPTHNSTLAAGLALYMLYFDGEPGAEVISAASDRQQAHICFDIARSMVEANPFLASRTKIYRRELYVPGSESSYKVISSEAYSKHGLNLSAAIVDELHAHENGELLEVLRTSMGSRRQPLMFMITTAGYDRTSVCWQEHERALRVRDGIDDDATYLPVIYGANEQDDWRDEAVWRRANPGLGITIKRDYFETECTRAAQMPSYTNAFKRLHLNIWTTQSERWMEQALWEACDGPADLGALTGRECYVGLDLASTTDIAAMVMVFPEAIEDADPAEGVATEPVAEDLVMVPGRRYVVIPRFWIPRDRIESPQVTREPRIKAILAQWTGQGYITATRGNVIDNDEIRATINALGQRVQIVEIGYDPWGMQDMAPRLADDGFTMTPLAQTMNMLSPATKELERLIRARRLAHGGHPVLRWMFGNASARVDSAGRVKLDNTKSSEKIDGMDALVMAIRQAALAPRSTSIYDERFRRGESVLTVV